ncbi:MAG: tetratricopeptide repeat protein [Betaproteobacteria bacterium]|nr:tetratricopeptide repeat protein [Betaproteobacteria bacterium]
MSILRRLKSSLAGRDARDRSARRLLEDALHDWRNDARAASIEKLRSALALSPHLPELHYQLGRCLLRLGEYTQVVSAMSAALQRAPPYPLALHCQVLLAVAQARIALADGDNSYLPVPPLPADPPRISVIICSVDEDNYAKSSDRYRELLSAVPHEIIGIHDAKSLCEGYNRGVRASRGELLIFSHDDVEIVTPDFAARLLAAMEKQDLLGIVGATCLAGATWIGGGWPHLRGQIGMPSVSGEGNTANFFGLQGPIGEQLQVMDGIFLAARRNVALDLPFDEKNFDGWHLYDIDFTFCAHLRGFRCGIGRDQVLVHRSVGDFGDEWRFYRERFLEKHAGNLAFEGQYSWAQLDVPTIAMQSNEEWLAVTKHMVLAAHPPGTPAARPRT